MLKGSGMWTNFLEYLACNEVNRPSSQQHETAPQSAAANTRQIRRVEPRTAAGISVLLVIHGKGVTRGYQQL
jgi:hypothetical protein